MIKVWCAICLFGRCNQLLQQTSCKFQEKLILLQMMSRRQLSQSSHNVDVIHQYLSMLHATVPASWEAKVSYDCMTKLHLAKLLRWC